MATDLPVLEETSDWIAIDKPAGTPTIAENARKRNDALTQLNTRLGQKLFVVHRLDKYVTGVLVFAKNLIAYRRLRKQFSDRTIRKCYHALVHGVMKEDRLRIEKPLRRFCSGRVGVDEARGEPAVTHIEVVRRFEMHTYVIVKPETGRRHQIRSHLSSLGHPIAGDRRYGDKRNAKLFPTILLHAQRLEWIDGTGNKAAVNAALPMNFQTTLNSLQRLESSGFNWAVQSPLTLLSAV